MSGIVSRLRDRFGSEQADDADLRHRSKVSGCARVDQAVLRERVDLHGEIRSVSIRPVDDVTALEAELYDGTGTVTLIWLGRRRISGINAGQSLTATGRIGIRGKERVIYNPAYRLDS